MHEQVALQNALRSRLENIRIRFPRYSLRAFARKGGLSPATLSLILHGKRRASRKLAQQLSDRLFFDPQERSEILGGFDGISLGQPTTSTTETYVQLTMDQYRIVSDWRAFAILNLIKTIDFKNDPEWISARLGLSITEVEETLERLRRLEMITEEDGVLKRKASKYRTTDDVANASLRKSHQQNIELAHASLENHDVSIRDFTWITFALDMKKMSLLKTVIRKFQDDLLDQIHADATPTEVYRMAIQVFPLSQVRPAEATPNIEGVPSETKP